MGFVQKAKDQTTNDDAILDPGPTPSGQSNLQGKSLEDQQQLLAPAVQRKEEPAGKEVIPERPDDLPVAVLEASTSDSNLVGASGETTRYGFKKDRLYEVALNISTLKQIGAAGGTYPSGKLIEKGVVPAGSDQLHFGDASVTENGSHAFFLSQFKQEKKYYNSEEVTLTASNNGLLCLLRLAAAMKGTQNAMSGQIGGGIRVLGRMTMGKKKSLEDEEAREQNFYAGSITRTMRNTATTSYKNAASAMLSTSGQADKIDDTQPVGPRYKPLTDVAAAGSMLHAQLNGLWRDRPGRNTYVFGDMPIADLFQQHQPAFKADGAKAVAGFIVGLAALLKKHCVIDFIPSGYADFKADFEAQVFSAYDKALRITGSPEGTAGGIIDRLSEKVNVRTGTPPLNQGATGILGNVEGGVR